VDKVVRENAAGLTRKMDLSWARGSGPWSSGLVRVCESGVAGRRADPGVALRLTLEP